MPYIESKSVALIRKQVKEALPAFKFSVTREHYSKVNVSILSGPVDFGSTYSDVNPYWIAENYLYNEPAKTVLNRIVSIIDAFDGGTFQDDGDYGHIPEFYRGVSVGEWDKPYLLTSKN